MVIYIVIIVSIMSERDISPYPTTDPLPMEYYLNLLYFVLLTFIMPIILTYIVYRFASLKTSFMENWDDVKIMMKELNSSSSSNVQNKVTKSEVMLKTIYSYEKWMRTLWINRFFCIFIVLFSVNLVIFTPFTIYQELDWSTETGWVINNSWIGVWAISIWPLSFIIPLVLISLMSWWYYKKDIRKWRPIIQSINEKANNLINDSEGDSQ